MDKDLNYKIIYITENFERKHNVDIQIIYETNIEGNNFGLKINLNTHEIELLDSELCSLFNHIGFYYTERIQVQPHDNDVITTTYIYTYK